MRHLSQITAFVFDVSKVPQFNRGINRGCCQQPITPRVEFCMSHFAWMQLLIKNLNSWQCFRVYKTDLNFILAENFLCQFHHLPHVHLDQAGEVFQHYPQSQASDGLQTHLHSSTNYYKRDEHWNHIHNILFIYNLIYCIAVEKVHFKKHQTIMIT